MKKYNYSCEILDCDALRLTEDEAVEQIKIIQEKFLFKI
jgi:hypothetical protein